MDTDTRIQPIDALNGVNDGVLPSLEHHGHSSMIAFVRDLLEIKGSHVNVERSGRRFRLRFKLADAKTGRMIRNALELPNDGKLATKIAQVIQSHRQSRRDAKTALIDTQLQDEQRWRKVIRKRLIAACRHGRVVKRRLALVLDLALILGYCFVVDFLRRRPWNAQSPFHAGRRPKRS